MDKGQVVAGASANDEQWWDNGRAGFLGWTPKHTSARWRAQVMAEAGSEAPEDPAVVHQGGAFVTFPHPDDGRLTGTHPPKRRKP